MINYISSRVPCHQVRCICSTLSPIYFIPFSCNLYPTERICYLVHILLYRPIQLTFRLCYTDMKKRYSLRKINWRLCKADKSKIYNIDNIHIRILSNLNGDNDDYACLVILICIKNPTLYGNLCYYSK